MTSEPTQPPDQVSDLTTPAKPEPEPEPEPEPKSKPSLHPFFTPGRPSTLPTDTADDSEIESKRPSRSSRAKAPVSYREDLKAVLRADAAQESARRKEEKRQAQLQVAADKKALKSARSKPRQSRSNANNEIDDFELVETRVATSKAQHQLTQSSSSASSSSKPHQLPKPIEPKPLSLAVKGTGAAATANPHPFFTKKPKLQHAPPIDLDTISNHDQENTGTGSLQSADQKRKAPATSSSSTFNAAPASWSLFSTHRASLSKPKKPLYAPWPSHEDVHVVGLLDRESQLLSRSRSDLAAFQSRWQAHAPSSAPNPAHSSPPPDFVWQMNRTRPQPQLSGVTLTGSDEVSSTDAFMGQVVLDNLPQLACASAAQQADPCRKTGQLWVDAFRPHLASACLGNGANATYLLDWLRRLLVAAPGSVRTTDSKRKHGVQRRVDRKKKKRPRRGYSDDEHDDSDDMADFIVDDNDDQDAEGKYDDSVGDDEWFSKFSKIDRNTTLTDDESVASQGTVTSAPAAAQSELQETLSQLEPRQQRPEQPHFASLDRLTNCIVLTGPSGSGKTASVYACAAELGYEVFELYPGMGKRSGKELLAAVGDLGRNHMVSSGGVGGGATFKKASSAATISATTVRQSLILIEEADVLFEEDKGFWAAVVELVAESKRPVVVVCNDLELVPVQDLPVQQVLDYVKPHLSREVVPWLQTIAAQMGRFVKADRAEAMLLNLPSSIHPLDAGEQAEADLRQAINQIQFGHLACSPKAEQRHWLETLAAQYADMKAVARAAESSSLADVFESVLDSDGQAGADAFGSAGVDASSSSRQWGSWIQLESCPLASYQQRQAVVGTADAQLEYRSTFADLHAAIVGIDRLSFDCDGVQEYGGVKVTQSLLRRLQDRQASRLQTLVDTLPTPYRYSSSHLPPWLVTDYAPIIRLMALVDEDLAQIHASLQQQQQSDQVATQQTSGVGRSTRNSRAALTSWLTGTPDYGYERWLGSVGPEHVKVAQLTKLSF